MMKLISHIVIFALGATLGIMWSVKHPAAAQNADLQIQAKVSEAKIDLLKRIAAENPSSAAKYQQEAQQEQTNLDNTNKQLANQ
jgi:hypothetical protein